MNQPVLLVEQPDEVTAILTFNRPERRNALSVELIGAISAALRSLASEPRRRVVILRGAGPAFCAGLDLEEAAEAKTPEEDSERVAEMFRVLAESPLVTIAAAHGAAYAGGAVLLACCDLVVAADNLRICFPEVRRGLLPALAAAAMRGRVREGELRELVLLAEPVDARRALEMGLVNRVVARDRLLAEAQQFAAAVLQGAPEAVRQTKQLLREIRAADASSLYRLALDCHKQGRQSDEAREGMAAFRQRRPPRWSGLSE